MREFLTITAAPTSGASARAYVPAVLLSRGLAFLRLLLVARLLGDANKDQYGLYQQAFALINWVVPLVLLGLGDIAERYASRFQRENRLLPWLKRIVLRLALTATVAAALLIVASRWIAHAVFNLDPPATILPLTLSCAAVIAALAAYQFLASLLRGIRAFAASAALEVLSASLFLLLAGLVAAVQPARASTGLLVMYALSLLLPTFFFASLLWDHLHKTAPPAGPDTRHVPDPRLSRFGRWTLIRLLLMMSFAFLTIWGVGHLAENLGWDPRDIQAAKADYAVPYRVAEMLAYVALTAWGATYGMAAAMWSHGRSQRARVELFRAGRFAAAAIALLAAVTVLARPILILFVPHYAAAVWTLLPAMCGVFVWYGLLAFCVTYGDLRERPHLGAGVWAGAVVAQFLVMTFSNEVNAGPKERVVVASAVGLGMALLLLAPVALWRPLKLTATAVPLALLSLAALTLYSPPDLVAWIAPPTLLLTVVLLQAMNLLVRTSDRRRIARWWNSRNPLPAAAPSPQAP